MINLKKITEEQAREAIRAGEFSKELISSAKYVALVLTQDWCPQWSAMIAWLESWEKKDKPQDVDVDVYTLVYNNTPLEREFLRFKETVLGNYEIPYVRYYIDGSFVDDSNYVSRGEFARRFTA